MDSKKYKIAKKNYVRSVRDRAKTIYNWLKKDDTFVPPVLFVYQIGSELFFEGNPLLINKFSVDETFKKSWEAAIGRPKSGLGNLDLQRMLSKSVDIKEVDPMTMLTKDLDVLITNAVTGGHHVKGIWDAPKPNWWPSNIKFCSPNFRAAWGRDELTEIEKRQVVIALKRWVCGQSDEERGSTDKEVEAEEPELAACKQVNAVRTDNEQNEEDSTVLMEIDEDDMKAFEQETSDKKKTCEAAEAASTIEEKAPSSHLDRKWNYEKEKAFRENEETTYQVKAPTADSQKSPSIPVDVQQETFMINLVEKSILALAQLNRAVNWQDLTKDVSKLDMQLCNDVLTFLQHYHFYSYSRLPNEARSVDQRYLRLKNLPAKMVPVNSTPDGDCLFNSVCKLLFGREIMAPILRLGAVLHGIKHITCYVTEYSRSFANEVELQNFLFVITSKEAFENICGRSNQSKLRGAFTREILGMTRIKAYAGAFQIRLVAGVVGVNIGLHCQEDVEIFEGLACTCSCDKRNIEKIVHVMLVKASEFGPLNHYIPLFWKGSYKESQSGAHKGGGSLEGRRLAEGIPVSFCAQISKLGCLFRGSAEHADWVQCSKCKLKYHGVCIGINPRGFRDCVKLFICCEDVEIDTCQTPVLRYPEPLPGKRSDMYNPAIIYLYDINQHLRGGISSATVDFFIRFMQHVRFPHLNEKVFMASHLLWEMLRMTKDDSIVEKKHQRVLPRDRLLKKDLLIFPVNLQENWHWVLIAVNLKDCWITVMDSMMSSTSTKYLIERFQRYLEVLGGVEGEKVPNLVFLPTDCAQQTNSIDCGIYMLGNIEFLLKKEYVIAENKIKVNYQQFDESFLRLDILRKMYELQ